LSANSSMCSSEDDLKCAKFQFKNQSNIMSNNCGRMCPLECNYSYYHLKTSSQTFPTSAYANHLRKNVKNGENKTVDEIKDSVARAVVYYKNLNYKLTNEQPAFPMCTLLGNIGGN